MKRLPLLTVSALCVIILATPLWGDAPNLLNYQGYLTNLIGEPLAGTFDLTFTIYDGSEPGATQLWTETHTNVQITEGIFHLILGSVTTIPGDLFNETPRWIGIAVDSDPEIDPRMQMTSVPWALKAAIADTAHHVSAGAGDGHSLSAVDGDPMDVVFVDEGGRVNIGTTNYSPDLKPWATLNIASNEGLMIHGPDFGYGWLTIQPYHPGMTEVVHEIRTAAHNEPIRFGPNDDGSATNVQITGALSLKDDTHGYGYLTIQPYHPGMTEPVHEIRTAAHNEIIRFAKNDDGSDANVEVDGYLSTGVLEITGGSDLAEPFPVQEADPMIPGMVVSIDPEIPGSLVLSAEPYDSRVAGIISGANDLGTGMVMSDADHRVTGPVVNVALTGRVWCWSDASHDPITPGDMLTTSGTPGHAMKATDRERSHGAVIGKAMSSLDSGRGLVLVLVNLQ